MSKRLGGITATGIIGTTGIIGITATGNNAVDASSPQLHLNGWGDLLYAAGYWESFACSKNRRDDSLAQERALLPWAIDGHCLKSGGVRFSATAIRAALESAGVIFVNEKWGRFGREASQASK